MSPETKWLMEYLDSHEILPEISTVMDELLIWACKDHGYASKNQRILEWGPWKEDLYEIVTQLFIGTLLHPEGMTYQAMIGYLSGLVRCKDPLDRAKCAAEVVAIAFQHDLVTLTRLSDQTLLVATEFELPVEIPAFGKHQPLFRKPEPIDYNPILGCRFKQHTADICLDHIDRMNAIPLALETRLIDTLEEAPNSPPETTEHLKQWEAFREQSAAAYATVRASGNRFHLEHAYDTRGRCYCDGYLITYQGSQYKKAIVQLAEKEIVQL